MAKENKNTKSKGKDNKNSKKDQPLVKVTRTERVVSKSTRAPPSHFDLSKEGPDFKHVVRISNTDIPGYLPISEGVVMIYGISRRLGKVIEEIFIKEANKSVKRIGHLLEQDVELLDNIIENLYQKTPSYLLNRSKLNDSDKKAHLVMADLKLAIRKDLQRLGKIKSYRGLRLQWGLTVRGQKTRSSFRKSSAVGVVKKKEVKGGKSK